jgi:hypothetical protein
MAKPGLFLWVRNSEDVKRSSAGTLSLPKNRLSFHFRKNCFQIRKPLFLLSTHLCRMKRTIFIFTLLLVAASGFAQDRYFARTYNSNVLGKGDVDVEVWHTSRFGHKDQFFHAMDQRMEFEVGLGSRWQTAVYLDRYQKSFSDAFNNINHTSEIGFSNEWKWQAVQGNAKRPGLALYGELGVKGDEIELETKLILDKSFGKNLVAFNLVYEIEQEFERENGETELETEATPLELDLAYMRHLNTSWGVGLEMVNHNDIEKGKRLNSVLYLGPTLNYRGNRFFIIANYITQLGNLRKTTSFPDNKVLNVHEKGEARLLLGLSF